MTVLVVDVWVNDMKKNVRLQNIFCDKEYVYIKTQLLKQCIYSFWTEVFLSFGNYRPNKGVHVLICAQQKHKNKIRTSTSRV